MASGAGGVCTWAVLRLSATWNVDDALGWLATLLKLGFAGLFFGAPGLLVVPVGTFAKAWLPATALSIVAGLLLAIFVLFALGGAIRLTGGPDWVILPIFGAVIGATVGQIQSAATRWQRAQPPPNWVILSSVGGAAFFSTFFLAFGQTLPALTASESVLQFALAGAAYGLPTGYGVVQLR